jgi:hypothetical protein
MHTARGTVLRKSNPQIRNHANKDGESGTGVNFRHSHAATRHIRTAHIITQLHKIHSQPVALATALMYQVAGFTCSFVFCIGLQPDGVTHNSLVGDAYQLVFYYVRYAKQPTITVLTFAIQSIEALSPHKHV